MAGAYITQIVNANVYVDGNSLLGRAKEINMAELTAITTEYKGLGMVGTIEAFAGWEKMEGSATWNSFYPDIWRKIYNPMKAVQLMVRGNLQTVTGDGIQKEEAIVTSMGVIFKKVPAGAYKPQEATEFATDFAINSIVQKLGGSEILAFDPVNNIYRLNGVDMLAQYRANLGL